MDLVEDDMSVIIEILLADNNSLEDSGGDVEKSGVFAFVGSI